MKKYLPYNKALKQNSRDLRNHSTLGEILLWQKLKARSFMGYQFNRQKPLDNYIVDFYCQALRLVIEIDGAYHRNEEVHKADLSREQVLNGLGLTIIRFEEMQVRTAMSDVLSRLEKYILEFEETFPECKQHNYRKRNPRSTNPKE